MSGQGYQMLRVDLTTAEGVSQESLTDDFKKLRRVIERKFKAYEVHFFKVQTYEVNGVLHMVWAIRFKHAVWISQRWLSDRWGEIHGSPIVYIRRVKGGDDGLKRISRYLVSQYLAGQDAIARVSWSWRRDGLAIGRAWKTLKMLVRQLNEGLRLDVRKLIRIEISFSELLLGWKEILTQGVWEFSVVTFKRNGRSVALEVPNW